MGYPSQSQEDVISAIGGWLLTCEAGLLIVPAAALFAWTVWMFERARRRLEFACPHDAAGAIASGEETRSVTNRLQHAA